MGDTVVLANGTPKRCGGCREGCILEQFKSGQGVITNILQSQKSGIIMDVYPIENKKEDGSYAGQHCSGFKAEDLRKLGIDNWRVLLKWN